MKKYRVVRSNAGFSHGYTYSAASARDAVAMDARAMRQNGPLGAHVGACALPVTAVYELRPVPESQWR